MDLEIVKALNTWAASSSIVSGALSIFVNDVAKNLLPVVLIWAYWFSEPIEKRTEVREKLIATFAIAVLAVAIGRLLANLLPFRKRPMYDSDAGIVLLDWIDPSALSDWSSFPSDHAILFFAMAMGIFGVSRRAGLVAFFHAAFVVCFARVAVGWHWPSDIIAGAFIGVLLTSVLFVPIIAAVRRMKLVSFVSSREYIGYPILFLASYELGIMFRTTRSVINILLGVE